ncbi:MAG: hypothetical protein K0R54_5398 [Clostridiaceae bacterium]|nr:hypothetical protein [Clostridiaceae bacterium]
MIILEKPYTIKELIDKKNENGYVEGVVKVKLSELVEGSYDDYLDTISEKLTGSSLLREIQDRIVGADEKDNAVLLSVKGDVTAILEMDMELNEEE